MSSCKICRMRHLLIGGFLLAFFALGGCSGSSSRLAGRGAQGSDGLEGIASYYAEEYDGRRTASGEIYDAEALTAAHPTLPFNTTVRVTNLDNGRSVDVRINDRGPYKKGRIVDLSYRAARMIGLIAEGTAPVRLEILRSASPGK